MAIGTYISIIILNVNVLKATREKQKITYKGIPIRLSADFSAETAGQKGVAGYT